MGTGKHIFKFCGLAICILLAVEQSLATAKILDCTLAVRKAMRAIKSAESHPRESLNLGWTALDIAEAAFDGRDFLEVVPAKTGVSDTERLRAYLNLQDAGRKLTNEYRAQEKTKFHRGRLDDIRVVLHEAIEDYLPKIGVQVIRKRPGIFYGQFFTYISIDGTHPLNRAARALYEEYGLHTLITGKSNLMTFDEYLQIPPQLLATSAGVTEFVDAITKILSRAQGLPAAFVSNSAGKHQRMEDGNGSSALLDWGKLIDQTVQIKFRDQPPTGIAAQLISKHERLNTSRSTLQQVMSLESYLFRYPSGSREKVKKSLSERIRNTDKPFVYVGVEAMDSWWELWPVDAEPANVDSMSHYIDYFVQDERFIEAIEGLESIRFHIIIGDRNAQPISAVDAEVYDHLESEIYSALHQHREKYPPTFIDNVKLTLNHDEVMLFEFAKPNVRIDLR